MNTFHINFDTLIKTLFEFERKGLYEEAFQQLRSVWSNFDKSPDLSGFEPFEEAEFLLRSGSIIGFLGQSKQIQNAQETSRNILTKARQKFLNIYNFEKVAECSNYLAISYLRTGEHLEAKTWLDDVYSYNIPKDSDVYFYAQILESVFLQAENKHLEVISKFQTLEKNFIEKNDNFFLGCFYTNYGMSLRMLGNTVEALRKYEKGRLYHQKSQHGIYLGTVENNLANIYKKEKNFRKAHQSIDSAINIFRKIKDRSREGFSFDTKASIYIAEGKYLEALETIAFTIRILEKGENKNFYIESLQTKVNILLNLDKMPEAMICLFEAYKIAELFSGKDYARRLLVEFEELLKSKNEIKLNSIYQEKEVIEFNNKYKLEFHDSISAKGEVSGIRIKNSYLEEYGLIRGTLAITSKEELKKGDLVAVLEKENDLVVCGFYDYDYGIICLDNGKTEPILYNENEIQILGKIIGYCHITDKTDGKLFVSPILI